MIPLDPSLGITQHLIKEGIASLEEVRDKDGKLENLYVRVCSYFRKSTHMVATDLR